MTDHELSLLSALDEVGGYTTGRAASRAHIKFGHNARTSSAFARRVLLRLQARGLVTTLDGAKPVCWVRTWLGTTHMKIRTRQTSNHVP
jgi:hypothetical protein